jgi:hypothetical protein
MRQPVVAPLLLWPFAALDKTDCRLRLNASCGCDLAVCHPYATPVIAPDVHGVLAQMPRDDAYRVKPRRKKPETRSQVTLGAKFAEPLPGNITQHGRLVLPTTNAALPRAGLAVSPGDGDDAGARQDSQG